MNAICAELVKNYTLPMIKLLNTQEFSARLKVVYSKGKERNAPTIHGCSNLLCTMTKYSISALYYI